MVAETQGQYRYHAVCSSVCHTMYTVTERPGRKLGWPVLVWLFCDVLRRCSHTCSHTFYFEGTELCVGPDPYRKGSMTGN